MHVPRGDIPQCRSDSKLPDTVKEGRKELKHTRDGCTETGPALRGEERIHDGPEQRAPAPLDRERLGEGQRERADRPLAGGPEFRDRPGREGPGRGPVTLHPGEIPGEPRVTGDQGSQRGVLQLLALPHRGGLHHQRVPRHPDPPGVRRPERGLHAGSGQQRCQKTAGDRGMGQGHVRRARRQIW